MQNLGCHPWPAKSYWGWSPVTCLSFPHSKPLYNILLLWGQKQNVSLRQSPYILLSTYGLSHLNHTPWLTLLQPHWPLLVFHPHRLPCATEELHWTFPPPRSLLCFFFAWYPMPLFLQQALSDLPAQAISLSIDYLCVPSTSSEFHKFLSLFDWMPHSSLPSNSHEYKNQTCLVHHCIPNTSTLSGT